MIERKRLELAIRRHRQLKATYDKLAAMLLFTQRPAKVLKAFNHVKRRLDTVTSIIGCTVKHYQQAIRNEYENRKRAK